MFKHKCLDVAVSEPNELSVGDLVSVDQDGNITKAQYGSYILGRLPDGVTSVIPTASAPASSPPPKPRR
jgi:hypothetical protein